MYVIFLKNVRTLPKGHMHIFSVFITTVQGLKNVGVWKALFTQSVGAVNWKHAGKMTMFNYMYVIFLKNVRTLPKSHMHIFSVFITTVQGLKNVGVWKALFTQSVGAVNWKYAGKMTMFNYM
jgi:predicted oxidoreductase (fatty acid repression mutant protein)